MTITAKVQIYPNEEQAHLLLLAGRTFAKACNYVSDVVFESRSLNQVKLQKTVYVNTSGRLFAAVTNGMQCGSPCKRELQNDTGKPRQVDKA